MAWLRGSSFRAHPLLATLSCPARNTKYWQRGSVLQASRQSAAFLVLLAAPSTSRTVKAEAGVLMESYGRMEVNSSKQSSLLVEPGALTCWSAQGMQGLSEPPGERAAHADRAGSSSGIKAPPWRAHCTLADQVTGCVLC